MSSRQLTTCSIMRGCTASCARARARASPLAQTPPLACLVFGFLFAGGGAARGAATDPAHTRGLLP